MDHLPVNDIPMLVSAINFLLRDEEFDNLEQICYHFGIEQQDIEARLDKEGYHYDRKENRIW